MLLLCLPRKLGNVKSVVSASPRGYPAEAPEWIIALQRPNQVFVPRPTTRADVILVALPPPAPFGCPPEGLHVLHERDKPLVRGPVSDLAEFGIGRVTGFVARHLTLSRTSCAPSQSPSPRPDSAGRR